MGGVKLKARVSQNNGETLQMRTWIKTMREARGLSLRQLGERLGIQGNSVHVAERREASGGISVYQLQRIAAALDCDLFYAFVPKQRTETVTRKGTGRRADAVREPDNELTAL